MERTPMNTITTGNIRRSDFLAALDKGQAQTDGRAIQRFECLECREYLEQSLSFRFRRMSRSVQIRAGQIFDEDDGRKGIVSKTSQGIYPNAGAQCLLTVVKLVVRQWREVISFGEDVIGDLSFESFEGRVKRRGNAGLIPQSFWRKVDEVVMSHRDWTALIRDWWNKGTPTAKKVVV
ncbi:hypothetical protein SISNIDRAFT_469659 [Sistotremastrum niveocremeum HHB9708]|uniref:Uncharacterized protein n=1 Tax=Sistotremastrum niveocremeum HHB9708 TaxID=1314777 RepID=A0A164PQS7_9AGAM|nr:hypothetical protein SISNIDRAFT_469659 [Sistotremastrum niveocremeum HHB9708]